MIVKITMQMSATECNTKFLHFRELSNIFTLVYTYLPFCHSFLMDGKSGHNELKKYHCQVFSQLGMEVRVTCLILLRLHC